MRSRLILILSSLVLAYFSWHSFTGAQGLGQWSELRAELREKHLMARQLNTEIAELRRDIERLTPGSIDADLMEELARTQLHMIYPGEIEIREETIMN